jgi:hypothetical protein
VFQQLRQQNPWWLAPSAASIFGNMIDTFTFFCIAFYHSSNPFFATHWVEIAWVDLGFKIMISLVSFIPFYGMVIHSFKQFQLSAESL